MKTSIIIITVLLFNSFNVFCKIKLTEEEMQEVARTVITVDLINNNYNFIFSKSEKNIFENKDVLCDLLKEYNQLLLDCQNQYLVNFFEYNDFNYWKDTFNIFYANHDTRKIGDYYISSSILSNYILAVSYYGKVYYLYGFKSDNFKKLLKDKILPIKNEQEALKIGYIYLHTVKFKYSITEYIIDEFSYNEFKRMFPTVKLPACKVLDNNVYELTIQTIIQTKLDKTNKSILDGDIITHTIKIYPDGQIEYSNNDTKKRDNCY